MKNSDFQSIIRLFAMKLGIGVLENEWEYFKEYARKFPTNTNEKRYGILPMGKKPSEENMIYANDTPELRIKHLKCISVNGIDAGHKVRLHLDWLERLEGKQ